MTGKCPWITLDNEEIADSQLAINRLAEVFSIDLYESLSPREIALAESVRTTMEEYMYWILVMDR